MAHSFRTFSEKVWNSLIQSARETVCFKDKIVLEQHGMVLLANVPCAIVSSKLVAFNALQIKLGPKCCFGTKIIVCKQVFTF
jgi:hypothetical protein